MQISVLEILAFNTRYSNIEQGTDKGLFAVVGLCGGKFLAISLSAESLYGPVYLTEGGPMWELKEKAAKNPEEKIAKEKKDTIEKDFLGFPDIAADVINVLLYQGDRVVDPNSLISGSTESIYQGMEKLRSQFSDLCKYEMIDGRINLVYLIANQTKTDGKMLLRKAGYIGGIYREQYDEKMQNLFPVVELVLYWGKPRWKSGRDSRTIFRRRKISESTWKYIDEIKVHVFEMQYLSEEIRKLFKSDMRIVVDFLAEGSSYCSDRKVKHKAALIKMIKTLSGEKVQEGEVEKWLEDRQIREEDEVKVCELFDQYERKGRAEGRVEGEERLGRLMEFLLDDGRHDDARKAAKDPDYRKQLYAEIKLA